MEKAKDDGRGALLWPEPAPTTMRIAEIAVVSPDLEVRKKFISAICEETPLETDRLLFGRLQINDQLVLHLYGLDYFEKDVSPTWDLVARKLLGYVVLFEWNREASFDAASRTVDLLSSKYNLPIVIAATLPSASSELPESLLTAELALSDKGQFTFCQLSDPQSIKRVLITLVNTVMEHM